MDGNNFRNMLFHTKQKGYRQRNTFKSSESLKRLQFNPQKTQKEGDILDIIQWT
jgi:hypothetical protein